MAGVATKRCAKSGRKNGLPLYRIESYGGSFAVTAADARHDGLLWAAAGGAALLALVLGGRAIVRRKKDKARPEAPGTTE